MKRILCKSEAALFLLLPLLSVFMSCSEDDYINVIPGNSIAIMSVDIRKIVEQNGNENGFDKIKELLKINDIRDCGIDLSKKLYFFETVDGNIGFVAKVSDMGDLAEWLNNLFDRGYCKKTFKRKDFLFTVIKDSWVAGASSDALFVLGPVLPSRQDEAMRYISKYLEQDEGRGVKKSLMFDRLVEFESSVAVVAQAAALPEKFVAPFTIGAPADADASQIMISAEFENVSDSFLEVRGEMFSFNKDIDDSLKETAHIFRPISGLYLESMPSDAFLGTFMNVDGKEFIKLLNSNKSFQALLAGINTAIDMDNIIRCIDGDMAVVIPSLGDDGMTVCLGAKLSGKDFLKDVSYWKSSCPAGSRITDWERDAYCYTVGKMHYYFGVSDDMQFYSGNTPDNAHSLMTRVPDSFPPDVLGRIKGRQFCMVMNVGLLRDKDESGVLSDMLAPLFGNVRTVLYSKK